jgi:DNA polymerase III delta prime subunit
MKKINNEEYLWVERYRPQTIDDVVLPQSMKESLKKWVKDGEIPNLGFFGSPGLGKGSLYNALLKDMNTDYIVINGSKDNGIDVLRTTISKFASTKSLSGKVKIIILDEADHISQSASAGLRNDVEAFSKNARFIFTGNYKDRIIPALLNRLQVFDMDKIFADHKQELGIQILNRLKFILENENIQYDVKDLAEVVKTFYPSTRGMINFLQQNSSTGKFILAKAETLTYKNILDLVSKKDYKGLRESVKDISMPEMFYSWFWKNMDSFLSDEQQIKIIPKLAEFQDMSSRALNKEIPLMAFLVTLMQL